MYLSLVSTSFFMYTSAIFLLMMRILLTSFDSNILKNLLVDIFCVEREASFKKLTPIKTTKIAP